MDLGVIKETVEALIKPIADMVDDFHFSAEEKARIQVELKTLEAQLLLAFTELQAKLADVEARIVEAEARVQEASFASKNVFASSWRPAGMFLFLFLIGWNYWAAQVFGYPSSAMPADMMTIVKVGFIGVAGLRTLEKYGPAITALLGRLGGKT